MKVKAAVWVEIDAHDLRTPHNQPVSRDGLVYLETEIRQGRATVQYGLLGWPPYNATLFVPEMGDHYHALVEEE